MDEDAAPLTHREDPYQTFRVGKNPDSQLKYILFHKPLI
jgi:hypothetical protein